MALKEEGGAHRGEKVGLERSVGFPMLAKRAPCELVCCTLEGNLISLVGLEM